MRTTTNYGLKKPDGTDLVNIEDLNANMDIIAAQLVDRETLIKNASAKMTLVDSDSILVLDSGENSTTKKITFSNMKSVLKPYFYSFYNKYVHPNWVAKKIQWSSVKRNTVEYKRNTKKVKRLNY